MNKPAHHLHIEPVSLITERLHLKPVEDHHLPYIAQYLGDNEVRTNMRMPVLDTDQKLQEWWDRFENWRQQKLAMQWSGFFKETGAYACLVTLKNIDLGEAKAELGYSVLKQYWKQGVAYECAREVLNFAFNRLGFTFLYAQILEENQASQRVIEKLGFQFEKRLAEPHRFEGKEYSMLQFCKQKPVIP